MRDITMCHPRLQELAGQWQRTCKQQGILVEIGECYRTKEEQDTLYAQGRTKPGQIVTNSRGISYSSQHQWGIAFDFYLRMDIDGDGAVSDDAFNDSTKMFERAAGIAKQLGLAWGGDWRSIIDKPHLYLPDWGSTTAKLKQLYGTPDKFKATWKAPEPVKFGWNRDNQGKYRYGKLDGSWAANEWLVINHHWYLFGPDTYMLTGWQRWNGSSVVGPDDPGDWYFLDNTQGGPLEGACWHGKAGGFGGLEIWEV